MVSIIVPVYNVEKYIERCVNSLLNQTYKNYEIILVDDGAIDQSGIICDRLQRKYSCIRTIHQNNLGVSAARNTGIRNARGEYIAFVDGDDFVDKKYIDILLKSLNKYKADIACCRHLRTSKEYCEREEYLDKEIVFSGENILKEFLKEDMVSCCGKLYRRKIFKDLRFPVGRCFGEDIITVFKAFEAG